MFSRKNMLPKEYSTADMADDQAKALKTLGISDAYVLGVSQGGMIAMHLAAKYPELVSKLVLANTAPYANEIIKTAVGSWLDMAERDNFKDIFIDTAEKTYSEKKLKIYRRFYGIFARMSEPESLERFIIQGNACIKHDARPWLGKIQVPTLIVGGERDYIVGNKAAHELSEYISDSTLKIYEEYGHGAFEEAKDFNDLVLGFFACVRGGDI
ncbi:MAG: alpha/beta hydrolase [Eubacteriales bacterium]|nr:alpha/beta hydrolase [Eubacteriales bacterium]